MVTDKRLCQRSNIMIAFLFVPDLLRVVLCNLEVVESFNLNAWNFPDVMCLVVGRWGIRSCYSGKLWLMVAIAVHRYFLCVKMRTGIDSTKMSIAISITTLISSMSMYAGLTFKAKWDVIFKDIQQNGTMYVGEHSIMDHESLACKDRNDIEHMTQGTKMTLHFVGYIIPMIVQSYFYIKIYQHLKEQRQRFESNQQVASRLHRNSKAILRTLLALFLSHFLSLVPLVLINNLTIKTALLDKVLRIMLLNILCSLDRSRFWYYTVDTGKIFQLFI